MGASLSDYDYPLPQDLIAQTPVEPRDSSRLMVIERKTGRILHYHFRDLLLFLGRKSETGSASKDLLVANNTRVMPARLLGHRLLPQASNAQAFEPGGKIEFLMLERKADPLVWEGMFHAACKHKPGILFEIPTPEGEPLRGEIVRGASESPVGTIWVKFNRDPLTSGAGQMPLPPYIERKPEATDTTRYQTEYAQVMGSAAAPTAGLHFTRDLLAQLKAQGVGWEEVTLHVGIGTFRPVKEEDISRHQMHEEHFEITESVAERINEWKASGGKITAVGTTTVRALESASRTGQVRSGRESTQAFFYPGHAEFKTVDQMITNFHLPKSTLLMMVCAFAGRELTFEAYRLAIQERYRFFSYGDAMLIL